MTDNLYHQEAETIARRTGELLMNLFLEGDIEETLKEDQTLVTIADHRADRLIRETLSERFPEHGLLTEETCTAYPSDSELVWVIDPLDGTTNFSQGLHHWGTSLALLDKGQPAAAALYFPLVDEMYTAARNQGAWFNGRRLDPGDTAATRDYSFFLHCSRTHQRFQVSVPFKTRSLGSAAYHLCAVAKGTGAAALETTVHLWDLAGAWLVLKETGKEVETYREKPPFPAEAGIDYNEIIYTVTAADSGRRLDQIKHWLDPK